RGPVLIPRVGGPRCRAPDPPPSTSLCRTPPGVAWSPPTSPESTAPAGAPPRAPRRFPTARTDVPARSLHGNLRHRARDALDRVQHDAVARDGLRAARPRGRHARRRAASLPIPAAAPGRDRLHGVPTQHPADDRVLLLRLRHPVDRL